MTEDRQNSNNLLSGNTRRGVLAGTAGLLSGCSGLLPGDSEETVETETNTDTPFPSLIQRSKVTADDGDIRDGFGGSVAVDGETAVIGASRAENPNGERAGSVYLFSRSNGKWNQQGRLIADDGDSEDQFGNSVAVDGETAVIGAHLDEDSNGEDAGSAYVFSSRTGEWIKEAKLVPDDGDSGDEFGRPVAVDGETAVIGARFDEDPNGENSGSAYVFSRIDGQWRQQTKLAPDHGGGDLFGVSVAVSGETAVVGANWDDNPNGEDAGSAYVYSKHSGEWRQQTKLAPDDGDNNDSFGYSVAVDGETAVISAFSDEDPKGHRAGSAYVYSKRTGEWRQEAKLTAADGDRKDGFGVSVAVDGEMAVIGSWGEDEPNGQEAGAAYVYLRISGEWRQLTKLTADDGDSNDRFGRSVAVDGETVVIGASGDEDPNGEDAGSAYVFSLDDD